MGPLIDKTKFQAAIRGTKEKQKKSKKTLKANKIKIIKTNSYQLNELHKFIYPIHQQEAIETSH